MPTITKNMIGMLLFFVFYIAFASCSTSSMDKMENNIPSNEVESTVSDAEGKEISMSEAIDMMAYIVRSEIISRGDSALLETFDHFLTLVYERQGMSDGLLACIETQTRVQDSLIASQQKMISNFEQIVGYHEQVLQINSREMDQIIYAIQNGWIQDAEGALQRLKENNDSYLKGE